MTWSDVKKTLTTPPPPRPPPPKAPLFTTDFFSTKSFGPGHLVGAGVLAVGIVGLAKFFIKRGREQAEQTREFLAQQPRPASPLPDVATVAQTENQRGQYGKRP
jgi:hypothetical protein